jgi:SAM-dependent methyltransferase
MTDRKAHWEQVYANKSPLEVSWYQKEPVLSLRLIRETGVPKDGAIIDVGGGASVLVDYLLDQGYSRVAVLDLSGAALSEARRRLGKRAESVEWYEADVTEFVPPQSYDLWHDRAVFHFLTEPDDRRRYVGVLKRALSSTGQVIIGAFGIGGPSRCSGLDIVQYDAATLCAALGPDFQLVAQADELHVTPAGKEQKFSWFRLARRA